MDRSTGVVGEAEKMEIRCLSGREEQPPVLRVPRVDLDCKAWRVRMVGTWLGLHPTKTFESRFAASLLI